MSMRAVRFHETGAPEVLRCEVLPVPRPGPGEVLVRVLVSGVNYADAARRAGRHYPVPTPLPFVAGGEVAGEVCDCGEGVERAWLGRRVLGASVAGGGYAQFIAMSASELLHWPDGLDTRQAGALLIQGATAAVALQESGNLHSGESVLVLGTLGASMVIAGVGSSAKRDPVLAMGAHVAVDYSQPNWQQQVLAATGGRGVDLLLDATYGELLCQASEALADFGRIVLYGSAARTSEPLDLLKLLVRNQRVTGCFLGAHLRHRPARTAELLGQLGELVRQARVVPAVHDVLPLEEAARAHELLESRSVIGKLLLDPWM
jgi:NADPH2:quinone reductase